jgi:hypothetical protein
MDGLQEGWRENIPGSGKDKTVSFPVWMIMYGIIHIFLTITLHLR